MSRAIAGLDLLPALAAAPADAAIVADGFSCRRQIADLADRPARHAALLLAEALAQEPGATARSGARWRRN